MSRRDALASYTRRPKNNTRSFRNRLSLASSATSSSSLGSSASQSSSRNLAGSVVKAADSSRRRLTVEASSNHLNIAQLRLTNMNLHGREEEIKLLRDKLSELTKGGLGMKILAVENYGYDESPQSPDTITTSNNLILVRGSAGVGKSTLIKKGLGEPAQELGYIFAKGKFYDNLRRPLSAISDAMTNLFWQISKCRREKSGLAAALIWDEIHYEFEEDEFTQMRRFLPECVELIKSSIDDRREALMAVSSMSEAAFAGPMKVNRYDSCPSLGGGLQYEFVSSVEGKEAVSRLYDIIRRLLKIVSSRMKGLILSIDDLHWSDTATLDLLKNILVGDTIKGLLIVGAYRDDGLPNQLRTLHSYIRDLEQKRVSITQMKIGDLSVENVIPLVAEALGMDEDDSKVEKLACIVHKKTEGNPFFVSMFLTSLYDEEILRYNFGLMVWNWDDDAVNSKIVTDNVVSVLINKMNRLSGEAQTMLMVASCLGASFRIPAIEEVMKRVSYDELTSSIRSFSAFSSPFLNVNLDTLTENDCSSNYSVESLINELEKEGLVETDNETCHFAHNQLQSAALGLISPQQRDQFRGMIGGILLRNLDPEELDITLFQVADLLNCTASEVTGEDCEELAMVNLNAGKKACENGSFNTAKAYFMAGHEVLKSRGWGGDYTIMLELCSGGANACFLTGDFETMNELVDEVLSKNIDVTEKFRVTEIKVKSLHAIGKVNEAIDVALAFRRQLHLPTPPREAASKIYIKKEYIRVQKLLGDKTAEDIANLPLLDDKRYEMGQKLNELLLICLLQVQPAMLPRIIFLMVTTTLTHGLNPSSCDAFAWLGTLLCERLGSPYQGRVMAEAAELILEQPGMRRNISKTTLVVAGYCHHWTAPLQDTIAPLLKGCEEGLEIGDNASACSCLVIRCYCLYFIGRSLDRVQEELEATTEVTSKLKQDARAMSIGVLLETVKKLRGLDDAASEHNLGTYEATAGSTGNFNLAAFVDSMRLERLVIFQQWKEAFALIQKAGSIRLALTSAFNKVRYTFLEALTCLKVAQTASGIKRIKMLKRGKKPMQLIQDWAKNGNVNVVHYLHILKAEHALREGKIEKAKESFKAAITASRKIGFIQDRALAHELAGAFYDTQNDEYWRDYHVQSAKSCYQEWGCRRKVKLLD